MDLSYLNNNGKKVSGVAAFCHYVYTVKGGEEEYNNYVGEMYIREFVNQHSVDINKEIEKDSQKRKFKVL